MAASLDAVALPGREGAWRITLRGGAIAEIDPVAGAPTALALPGLVNLHAHADRAFTVTAFRPASFADALEASAKARAAFTTDDVQRRATRFLERSAAHGTTRVRTHTDVDPVVGMRSIDGVLAARAAMAARIDVDVIAFSTSRNGFPGAEAVARMRDAIERKPAYLGLSINSADDPRRALEALLDLAEHSGLPIDLHIDEHLDADKMVAPMAVELIAARGYGARVTFSHLCALSVMEPSAANALIDRIARAGITVIALPETNLFLQDRGATTPRRRGVTLARELAAAGVPVRFGTDNVRDWFFPFGDGDMLDTALFATLAAGIDDNATLIAGLCDGRAALAPGDAADLVLVPATSIEDALSRRPGGRVVFKHGKRIDSPPPA